MKISMIQLEVADGVSRQERFSMVEKIFTDMDKKNCIPDIIILPELWGCGFNNFSGYRECAEPINGPTYQMMSKWAKKLGCYIHSGSFIEICEPCMCAMDRSLKLYNTSLLFDREGNDIAVYRKIHLFGFESDESLLLTPGKECVFADTEFGRIGLLTCYDLRFPEQLRIYDEVEKMPVMFIITAAWPLKRLEHWTLLNRVRAIENQCYIVSCNASGTQCGVTGAGNSMITAPDGSVKALGRVCSEIIEYEIDLGKVKENRETFPALNDRISFRK